MAINKVQLTSKSTWETQNTINDNFDDLDERVEDLETASSSYEVTTNKKTTISSSSTDTEYPSAKAVYTYVGTAGGKIDTIQKNGTDLPITDKTVNITVPTKTSDITNDSGFLTSHQDISGKADKVSSATNGNFAGLDSNGNLTDSGKKASDFILASQKGVASGVATLDTDGKVPTSQLPSFVDDVLEYASQSAFPATGESGKIYVALDTNKTYRWSGSAYVEISSSLALGETSSTAYRGDRGKTAYDHSQLTSGNPHNVSKSDVGLGNVDNTSDANKPISTATQTALNAKQNSFVEETFTASDSRWSAVDANGFYTLTITSAKKPFVCYNSNKEQVMAGLKYDGTNVYVITDTKFAGTVVVF